MCSAPLIVATTLSVGDVILLESVLSFLGLGVQPPLASWGSMLSNAQELIPRRRCWRSIPALMIFLTVIACNLLGDALAAAARSGSRPRRQALIAGKEKPPRGARRFEGVPGPVRPRRCRSEIAYGKTISTRRFCGSRTPSAVGTRLSFSPRPLTTMA